MSKYGDIIKEARKPENQKTIEPESQKAGKPDDQVGNTEGVNLSVKVSKVRRQHWVAEAKRQGTTLTAVIVEALNSRFGDPEAS
jgi:hypothetical protein